MGGKNDAVSESRPTFCVILAFCVTEVEIAAQIFPYYGRNSLADNLNNQSCLYRVNKVITLKKMVEGKRRCGGEGGKDYHQELFELSFFDCHGATLVML